MSEQFIAQPAKFNQPNKKVETGISKKIAKWLDDNHYWNIRIQSGMLQISTKVKGKVYTRWMHFAKKGTPDRLTLKAGKSVFIEVKKPGEKSSAEQKEQHQIIRESGGIVLEPTSLDHFTLLFSQIH